MERLGPTNLHAVRADKPRYDRAAVGVGIVHIGTGGFHRSHEAVYVDDLLAMGHRDWGICGVGTQPSDRRIADALAEQAGLYTVLVRHPDGHTHARVIGAIVAYLYAPDNPIAVVEQMAAASTRVVSLTITEGGYHVDPRTGLFTVDDAQVAGDLEPGVIPSSAFGLLTEALARRRDRGIPPFTVMSCDNIPGNGTVAREGLGGFASRRNPALGQWVRDRVAFPNSMVDRITPSTTDLDVAEVEARTGLHDQWPVVCEPYRQWVLEDVFADGRPPWEQVGVEVVSDVQPYEQMKLRLLNGGHQALAYLGYLAGYRRVDDACADVVLRRFVESYLSDEAAPTLPPIPGVDIVGYQRSILDRFSNAYISDSLARLATQGSDRITSFVVPVVRDRLNAGQGIQHAALVVAAWARYTSGVDERGEPIVVVDRLLQEIMKAAAHPREHPTAVLEAVPGLRELAHQPTFVTAFSMQLSAVYTIGARGAAAALLADST